MPEYIVTSIVPIDSLEELIRCKEPDRFGICMACKDEWLSAEVDE